MNDRAGTRATDILSMTQQGSPRPAPPTTGAQAPAATRLSIAQMLGVMRVEFHRARAQRQPMCCLMVAVDGMEGLLEKGAWQLKQAAMRAAYESLKTVARDRACFGMSLMSGDRIMAVFPSTAPAVLSEFGTALNERARKNPIDWKGQPVRLTLTVTVFPRTSEEVPPRRSKACRIAPAASAP